ncbi:hypothetical protein ACLB2K_023795 [Fragaria x ananassa]
MWIQPGLDFFPTGGLALIASGFSSLEVATMDKKVAAAVVMVKEVEGGECDGGGGGDCEGGGGNDDEGGGGEGDGSGEEVGSETEGSAVEGLRRRRREAMNQ